MIYAWHKTQYLLFLCLTASLTVSSQELEKKYLNNRTYTYDELIGTYKSMAKTSKHAQLVSFGEADNGENIQLFVIGNATNEPVDPYDTEGLGILIMNGIHAGESCGVDASLHWAESILNDIEKYW